MKKNMGTLDKALRILAAGIIASLYFAKVIEGTLALVLLVIAALLIVTSFLSVCPLYPLLGINTKKTE